MRLTPSQRGQRGVAMLLALMALLLVAGIATLMFARTLNEMRHSTEDTGIVQTLMLARGGANIGSGLLALDLHDELRDIVEITASPGRWAFGNDTYNFSDLAPEPASVVGELNQTATLLQSSVDSMLCGRDIMPSGSMGSVELRVYFTDSACGLDMPNAVSLPDPRFVKGPPRSGAAGVQEYSLPFVMVSDATLGDYRRNIVMQGEYRFEVGQASFAKYAYFTNRDSSSGSQIWFTENTMIDGPTHTNGHFAFYRDPWFGGVVTSVGCTNFGAGTCNSPVTRGAFFYDRPSTLRTVGSMVPNSNNPKYGQHAPRLDDGVNWGAQYVALPDNAFDQLAVAQGLDGRLDTGLYFGDELQSLTLWAADASGDSPRRDFSGRWAPKATHQFVEACHLETERRVVPHQWIPRRDQVVYVTVEVCNTWRYDQDGILQKYVEATDDVPAHWDTDPRPFNGVIYVAGDVERFRGPERLDSNNGLTAPPALASFAEVTLVAEEDVRLTGDLRYEEPPCDSVPVRNQNRTVTPANCGNTNHANVLGVYTPGGDIIVGNDHVGHGSDETLNAPDNMHVHAVLMSASNQIRVEGYVERGSYYSDRGQFFLLGGMIQENRGVFGTFGGAGRRGYDRVYTYDPRMARGIAPPYFPTTGLDTIESVRYFSFGQREQIF